MQATEDKTYNGYTNYETWAVALYLDGNYDGESTYRYVLDLVRETVQERNVAGNSGEQPFYASYVGDALKDWFGESLPDLGASIAADLLRSAVDEVNWRELAELKLAEVNES